MDLDNMMGLSFGIIGGMILLSLLPWWLVIGTIVGCTIPWYKRWRFKLLEPAEKKKFLDFSVCGYGKICDVEHMMYLGTLGDDDTIRWWYWRGGDGVSDYLVPQAIDNGEVYWDRKLKIENPKLLKHLHGFWDMGNEWPAYYKMINRQVEHIKKTHKEQKTKGRQVAERAALRKKLGDVEYEKLLKHPMSFDPEVVKAVASDLPRADYEPTRDVDGRVCATATISALDQTNAQLLDLQETVKELEQEIKGRCPTLDIKVNP